MQESQNSTAPPAKGTPQSLATVCPIGSVRAFALVFFLGVIAPWPTAAVLAAISGGTLLLVFGLFPQLYLAAFPFVFAATSKFSSDFLLHWPWGMLLTLLQWGAISAGFSFFAQRLSSRSALVAGLLVVAMVWLFSLGIVVVLQVPALPLMHLRT